MYRQATALRDTRPSGGRAVSSWAVSGKECLVKSSHCVPSQIFRVGYFVRHHVAMRLLGYTRVSTAGQDPALQLDALLVVGVQKRDVFSDVTSDRKSTRLNTSHVAIS